MAVYTHWQKFIELVPERCCEGSIGLDLESFSMFLSTLGTNIDCRDSSKFPSGHYCGRLIGVDLDLFSILLQSKSCLMRQV